MFTHLAASARLSGAPPRVGPAAGVLPRAVPGRHLRRRREPGWAESARVDELLQALALLR
jgi:hypothetical protein